MEEPILKVRGLCTDFTAGGREFRVVDGVDFELYKGETLGIVGESGCGKSVTALSIMQLLPKGIGKVSEGTIEFEGKDVRTLSESELLHLRGGDMSIIFQEPMTSLNPVLSIGYQMSEVLLTHQKMTKKEAKQKAIELLTSVGVSRPEQIVESYPHELSGGMLQRVMIAMGLSCNPKFLIADEPTTALDVTIQAQILDLMAALKKDFNTGILMITHNLGVVAEVCDRVVVMYAGQVVESAPVNELFANPKHPYTQGLLQCIPNIEETRDTLYTIEGTVPPPYAMPNYCRFADRCPYATDACFAGPIPLYDFSEEHKYRCIRYQEGNENV